MRLYTRKLYRSRRVHFMLYRLIHLYSWTFRLTVINEAQWRKHIKDGGRVLICAWHQQFFSAIRYFKNYGGYNPALMISRSLDGELIAGVAELSGWHAVRGSSSRGGKAALKEITQVQNFGSDSITTYLPTILCEIKDIERRMF